MRTAIEIPSVNFHLWQPCNMKCGFCFARFLDVKQEILPKGHLNREDCHEVVRLLAESGFDKINFAGGEPTLCPWLPELIRAAHNGGMATSVVTNGTKITGEWLDAVAGHLDWIAVSIDTVDPVRLARIGRTTAAGPLTERDYLAVVNLVKERGIRLKVNTVVSSANWDEDFTDFIAKARPERWKILQALPVVGQNDDDIERFAVSPAQFEAYLTRNGSASENGTAVVPEDNGLMRGSYVMVDPAGRFFDNTQGEHRYSRPIISVGVAEALRDVTVRPDLFRRRNGLYNWRARPDVL